jgi:PPP family 3-phenylpropionic acid transporter
LSRRFVLLYCGAGLMQGSHAFYYGFSAIAWTANGITERQVAWLWTTGVLAEILFFFASAAIIRRTGPLGLLLLAGACGVARWTLSGATTDLNWLFAIQLLHAGTFAAAHMGALHFIGAHAPEGRRATLQMIYTAAGTGLALGAMMLLSGHLYEAIGIRGFTAMAAASALGSILILFLARTNDTRRAAAKS